MIQVDERPVIKILLLNFFEEDRNRYQCPLNILYIFGRAGVWLTRRRSGTTSSGSAPETAFR